MIKDRSFQAITLGLVLVFLVGLFKPQPKYMRHENPISNIHFWINKTFSGPEFDVVILGDSRVTAGVSPQEMQKVLGGFRILNFSYLAGGLNQEMYNEAAKRLDPESQQEIIVLGVTPRSLTELSASNTYFHLYRTGPMGERFLMRTLYEPLGLERIGYVLPFFNPVLGVGDRQLHSPLGIQLAADHIFPLIIGEDVRIADDHELIYVNYADDGWTWIYPNYGRLIVQFNYYKDIFSTTAISEALVQDLFNQTRVWSQQGVHVFGFRPPSSPEIEALENDLSGFNERKFGEAFESAGGVWLSYPVESYESADGSHLKPESALRLSNDLAQDIQQHLSSFHH